MKCIVNCIGNRKRLVKSRCAAVLPALAVLVVGTISLSSLAWAEDGAQGARAVRLSSVDGKVQLSLNNQVMADQAVVNVPLFEGTQVVTADDGKAEIQFEDGSVARVSPNSSLTLKVLRGQGTSSQTELVLDGGLGYFELQSTEQSGTIKVRFGESVVTASGFTVMRIDVDNPPGTLAVFSGNAHLERGSAVVIDMHGGESVTLNASDVTGYNLAESIEPDSWDSWNQDRDQSLTAEAAAQTGAATSYVNNNSPAWNDLDANGTWYDVPGQGNVWSPYEASSSGWDPYGNGNWIFNPGYGYIWASGYPWGFMPYQCGAWNYYNNFGWGWAPGMGGCQPWWGYGGGGGGYFGPNIGMGFRGYHPPARPREPHGPRGPGGANGGRPFPVVGVVRNPSRGGGSGLPPRDRNTPIVIAGHTAQPIHPLPQPVRPGFGRPGQGFGNRTAPIDSGANRGTNPGAISGGARPGRGPEPVGGGGNGVVRPGYTPHPGAGGGQYPLPSGGPSSGSNYTPPINRPPSGSESQPHHWWQGGGSHNNGGGSSQPVQPNNPPSNGGGGGTQPQPQPSRPSGGGGGWHPGGGGGSSGGGGSQPQPQPSRPSGGGGGGGWHGGGGGGSSSGGGGASHSSPPSGGGGSHGGGGGGSAPSGGGGGGGGSHGGGGGGGHH